MNIDGLPLLAQIAVYKTRGLKVFLDNRPESEDFGESLDTYRRKLIATGELNDEIDKHIRAIHLNYQSSLLSIENDVWKVSSIQNDNAIEIKEFCNDLENIILCPSHDEERRVEFVGKYTYSDNPYILSELVTYLYRRNHFEMMIPVLCHAIEIIFSPNKTIWNQKERAFGAAMLANVILNLCPKDKLCNPVYITYLLLTRCITWPEGDDMAKRSYYELPISYEHRIGALIKRIELINRFRHIFENKIPNLSTIDTLIVSDYYQAHEFSFALEVLGRGSQFKRDAIAKYKQIEDSGVRPYSTCISDGKKDSVELAYRLHKSFVSESLALTLKEKEEIKSMICENLSEASKIKREKNEKQAILKYLKENNIDCFYHFTERSNLRNIRKQGGLLTVSGCIENCIIPKTTGEMRHLREQDDKLNLRDYVRLSFCKLHPLTKERKGKLILLKIKPEIAILDTTLFSDRDAAQESHLEGCDFRSLCMIDLNAVRKDNLDLKDPDYYYQQAEVMVKDFVPIEYILNIDNPEDL